MQTKVKTHCVANLFYKGKANYPISKMKFSTIFNPYSDKIDSGWNWTPEIGSVLWSKAITISFSDNAVITKSFGKLKGFAAQEWYKPTLNLGAVSRNNFDGDTISIDSAIPYLHPLVILDLAKL